MNKDLPFFPFFPKEYLTGSIVDHSFSIQGMFINVCCLYWHSNCDLNLDRVRTKFGQKVVKELTKTDLLKTNSDGEVTIEFLDEQHDKLSSKRENQSAGGKKGRAKQLGLVQGKSKDSSGIPEPYTEPYKEKDIPKGISKRNIQFYQEEIEKAEGEHADGYKLVMSHMLDNPVIGGPMKHCLKMKPQSFHLFKNAIKKAILHKVKLRNVLDNMENGTAKGTVMHLTMMKWIKYEADNKYGKKR